VQERRPVTAPGNRHPFNLGGLFDGLSQFRIQRPIPPAFAVYQRHQINGMACKVTAFHGSGSPLRKKLCLTANGSQAFSDNETVRR
ncbi:MAG: hypothetical protein ACK54P_04660, partial [Bacteroidota bacterium]